MSSIPTSKLLIGDLDKKVMSFIYNVRKVRGVVSGKIARIYNAKNKEILVENRGILFILVFVTIGNSWVKSLFEK